MSDHHTEEHVLTPATKTIRVTEKFIFGSRWILLPVKAGLMLALLAYVGRFLFDLTKLMLTVTSSDTETFRVGLLGLVDTAMVANLLVMTTLGGYQIFIRRPNTLAIDQRPQFLDHMDSGILKVKIALSIAGITLVQLLKDFVNIESVPWEIVVHRMIIHAISLVSALAMAFIWRVTHPSDHHNGNGNNHTEPRTT